MAILRVEVVVRAKHPKGVKLLPELLDEAVRQWVETGIDPPGMKIQMITWEHPGRGEQQARAGTGKFEDARETLLRNIVGRMERLNVRLAD